MEYAPLPSERWPDAPGRYPDPAVRVLDPRFDRCRLHNAAVERIATGYRWVEGPVWFGDHHCLADIERTRGMQKSQCPGDVLLIALGGHAGTDGALGHEDFGRDLR